MPRCGWSIWPARTRRCACPCCAVPTDRPGIEAMLGEPTLTQPPPDRESRGAQGQLCVAAAIGYGGRRLEVKARGSSRWRAGCGTWRRMGAAERMQDKASETRTFETLHEFVAPAKRNLTRETWDY